MSIQEHLNKIRNAIKGSEVRESIAKGIETAYDDASENGNANMEVKLARGTNPNLNTRLNKMDEVDKQTTAQLAHKASKSDVANISEGTPLFAENTSQMTDNSRLYVNTNDGLLYMYSNDRWESTGVAYQGTEPAEKSITYDKLSDELTVETDLQIRAKANWTEQQFIIVLSVDLGEELSSPGEQITFDFNFTSPTYPTGGARPNIRFYLSDIPANNELRFDGGEDAPLIEQNKDVYHSVTATTPSDQKRYLNIFLYITSNGKGSTQDLVWKNINLTRHNGKPYKILRAQFRNSPQGISLEGDDGFVVIDKRLVTKGELKNELSDIIEEQEKNDEDVVYLFGWHGQSNADGRAEVSTKPDNISDDVMMLEGPTSSEINVYYGNDIPDDKSSLPLFGKLLHEFSGEKIAILKYSIGATYMVPRTSEDITWRTGETGSYSNGAQMRFKNAYDHLVSLGHKVIPVGFTWLQGESDITHDQELYYQYFNEMVDFYEEKTGFDNLKVFISEIGESAGYEEGTSAMRKTLHQLVIDSPNKYFMIAKCPKYFIEDGMMVDHVHYNAKGYKRLAIEQARYVYQHYFRELPLPVIEYEW